MVPAGVAGARGRCCPAAAVPVAFVFACGVCCCIAEEIQNKIIDRKTELCHHRPPSKGHSMLQRVREQHTQEFQDGFLGVWFWRCLRAYLMSERIHKPKIIVSTEPAVKQKHKTNLVWCVLRHTSNCVFLRRRITLLCKHRHKFFFRMRRSSEASFFPWFSREKKASS